MDQPPKNEPPMRRPERDFEGLGSPRIWIYIVMLVLGMAWGVYFIYRTVYP